MHAHECQCPWKLQEMGPLEQEFQTGGSYPAWVVEGKPGPLALLTIIPSPKPLHSLFGDLV